MKYIRHFKHVQIAIDFRSFLHQGPDSGAFDCDVGAMLKKALRELPAREDGEPTLVMGVSVASGESDNEVFATFYTNAYVDTLLPEGVLPVPGSVVVEKP